MPRCAEDGRCATISSRWPETAGPRRAPGDGTAFQLCFPRLPGGVIEEGAREEPARAGGSAVAGSGTILLVEDDPAVRAVAARSLGEAGYRVLEAADGLAALSLDGPALGAVDLLVTDVIMPRLPGPELARELLRRRPGLRVLYLSGYPDAALDPHGVLGPGCHFLPKPFTAELLRRHVRQLLGGR